MKNRWTLSCGLWWILAVAAAHAEEADVATLTSQLKSADASQRIAAAKQLGELGPQAIEAAPALVAALADEMPGVLFASAEALGKMGPKAVTPLIGALQSDKVNVRVGAAHALSRIGPEAAPAVEQLTRLVETGDGSTRPGAIEALAAIGPQAKSAVPSLMKAAKLDDFQTQYRACDALGSIGPDAIEAAPLLQDLLTAQITSVRIHAAAALGGLGPKIGESGVNSLVAALQDRSHNVRQSAAIALGRLGKSARSAVPALETALDKHQIDTRVDAVEAIWKITGDLDHTLPRLTAEAVGEDDPERAAALLVSLGRAATPAVDQLANYLKSDDPLTRIYAATALGELGALAADCRPALENCEKNDAEPAVRMAAEQALKKISQPKTPSR